MREKDSNENVNIYVTQNKSHKKYLRRAKKLAMIALVEKRQYLRNKESEPWD